MPQKILCIHIKTEISVKMNPCKKKCVNTKKAGLFGTCFDRYNGISYSTVTDFARFLGWSTLQPRITAM